MLRVRALGSVPRMQLSPRYDGPPLLAFDLPLGDPITPMLRQRRRLADVLATFDDEQWAAPSRCEGWSAQDVMSHLVTTNGFWAISITSGLAGSPTRYLASFDPVASPAGMVDAARAATTNASVLEAFVESNAALAAAVDGLTADDWATVLAEAPPGHLPIWGVAMHALWDSWVHERDILLPLGLPVVDEPDELAGALSYGAGLGPAFLASTGSERTGAYVITATDPDVRLVVEVGPTVRLSSGEAPEGALELRGTAAELLEALSYRAPLVADVPADQAWMLDGLAEVFDQT